MCGITAISRAIGVSSIPDPRHFMKLAALAIEERGKDATGFAWVRDDGRSFYWKTPGRARNAINDAPLDTDITTAIGHTRWATQGDVKDNINNHPVVDDGIMLVHNGVIDNEYEIYGWLGEDFIPKAEVDSQCVASMLCRPDEFYSTHPTEMLELLDGSAALAWILPDRPDELHLARCQKRPMALGWTRYGDLIMSSTLSTLKDLALWSNIRLVETREVQEGTYLRVIGGEIVEERSFEPRRSWKSYTYSGTSVVSKHKSKSGKGGSVGAVREGVDATGATVVDHVASRDVTVLPAAGEWWQTEPWYLTDPDYYDEMFSDGFSTPLEEHYWQTRPEVWDEGFNEIDWDNLAPRRGWKVDDQEGAW